MDQEVGYFASPVNIKIQQMQHLLLIIGPMSFF